jgi:adenylate cyclase
MDRIAGKAGGSGANVRHKRRRRTRNQPWKSLAGWMRAPIGMATSFLRREVAGRRVSLRIGLSTMFGLFGLIGGAAITAYNYQQSSAAAMATADQLMRSVTDQVVERLNILFDPALLLVNLASAMPDVAAEPGIAPHPLASYLIRAMEQVPQLRSAYMGYDDGQFYQVVALSRDQELQAVLDAPEGTAYAVRSILLDPGGQRFEVWRFLGADLQTLATGKELPASFDPRPRPWYVEALAAPGVVITDPYRFSSSGAIGLTVARRFEGGVSGVFGVDISLTALSAFLARNRVSENARMALLDATGKVVAHTDLDRHQAQGGVASTELLPLSPLADPNLVALMRRFAAAPAAAAEQAYRLDSERGLTLGRVRSLTVGEQLPLVLASVAPAADFTAALDRTRLRSLLFSLLAVILILPVAVLFSHQLSKAFSALVGETERIQRFELEGGVRVRSYVREVDTLARALDAMKRALRDFGRYVPTDLVRQLVGEGRRVRIGGQRQDLTILFTDVAGFTTLSEAVDAEALMAHTSAYFEGLSRAIAEHHGVVDKYIGDAVMALWNAPLRDPDHVSHALRAVLACRAAEDRFNAACAETGRPIYHTRYGLHVGQAVVGNVGASDRINYTAVGATVNMAARLEGLNKYYGTRVLVSRAVLECAGPGFAFRFIDQVRAAGAHQPMEIHELLGPADASAASARLLAQWDGAMTSYRARRWREAGEAFRALTEAFPDDAPAREFLARSLRHAADPPPADWDGVTDMDRK